MSVRRLGFRRIPVRHTRGGATDLIPAYKTETARRGGWRLLVHFVVVVSFFSFVRVLFRLVLRADFLSSSSSSSLDRCCWFYIAFVVVVVCVWFVFVARA